MTIKDWYKCLRANGFGPVSSFLQSCLYKFETWLIKIK